MDMQRPTPDEPGVAADAFGSDQVIDLSGVDAIDPHTLLAARIARRVELMFAELDSHDGLARARFLDMLMGFSLAAESLHAAARCDVDACTDHMEAAQRYLGTDPVDWDRWASIWD